MKKVFLSVPMKNRTKENIEKSLEKMKAIAKVALGDDIEFINTIVKEKPPYTTQNEAVWYLGKSIQLLAQADILVCVDTPYWLQSKGCKTEKDVFRRYSYVENYKGSNYLELPCSCVIDKQEMDELYKNYQKESSCCAEAKAIAVE
jgi:hypothetical protein